MRHLRRASKLPKPFCSLESEVEAKEAKVSAMASIRQWPPSREVLPALRGDSEAFFFVGRQLGVPVALEGALKLKEISYDHAEGFAAGELKHGPLALVTPETPVLAVLTDGTRPDETMNNVTEAQTRGAPALGCVSSDRAYDSLDASFDVPDVGIVEPIVANVYLQLFAYHVANNKGRAIDKPRNLAKSLTGE